MRFWQIFRNWRSNMQLIRLTQLCCRFWNNRRQKINVNCVIMWSVFFHFLFSRLKNVFYWKINWRYAMVQKIRSDAVNSYNIFGLSILLDLCGLFITVSMTIESFAEWMGKKYEKEITNSLNEWTITFCNCRGLFMKNWTAKSELEKTFLSLLPMKLSQCWIFPNLITQG